MQLNANATLSGFQLLYSQINLESLIQNQKPKSSCLLLKTFFSVWHIQKTSLKTAVSSYSQSNFKHLLSSFCGTSFLLYRYRRGRIFIPVYHFYCCGDEISRKKLNANLIFRSIKVLTT